MSSDMETVVTPTQSVVAAALQAAWLQTPPTLGLDISTSSTGVALLDLQGDTRSLPLVHTYTCTHARALTTNTTPNTAGHLVSIQQGK